MLKEGKKGETKAATELAKSISFTGSKNVKLSIASDLSLALQERGFDISPEQIYKDYLGPVEGRKGETLNQKSKADRAFKKQMATLIVQEAISLGKLGGVSTRSQTLEYSTPELDPNKKLRVFDFDDTLFTSDSKIIVKNEDGSSREMTPEVFATYKAKKGETFDFSQFEQVPNPKPAKMLGVLDAIVKERGGEGASILTARPQTAAKAIKGVLEQRYGKEVANKIKIKGVQSSDPQDKARWIAREAIKGGFGNVYFADDSQKNVDAVGDVLNKTQGIIGRSQKVEYSAPEREAKLTKKIQPAIDKAIELAPKVADLYPNLVNDVRRQTQTNVEKIIRKNLDDKVADGVNHHLNEFLDNISKLVTTPIGKTKVDEVSTFKDPIPPTVPESIPEFDAEVYKFDNKDAKIVDQIIQEQLAPFQKELKAGQAKLDNPTSKKFQTEKGKIEFFKYLDNLYENLHPAFWRFVVAGERGGLSYINTNDQAQGGRGGRLPMSTYPDAGKQLEWMNLKAKQIYGVDSYNDLISQNPPGFPVIPWGPKDSYAPTEGKTTQDQFADVIVNMSRFINELAAKGVDPDASQYLLRQISYTFTRRIMPEVGGQQQTFPTKKSKSEYKDLIYEHAFPAGALSYYISKVARAAFNETDPIVRKQKVQRAMSLAGQNSFVLQVERSFDSTALKGKLGKAFRGELKDQYGVEAGKLNLERTIPAGFDMRTDHVLSRYLQ